MILYSVIHHGGNSPWTKFSSVQKKIPRENASEKVVRNKKQNNINSAHKHLRSMSGSTFSVMRRARVNEAALMVKNDGFVGSQERCQGKEKIEASLKICENL